MPGTIWLIKAVLQDLQDEHTIDSYEVERREFGRIPKTEWELHLIITRDYFGEVGFHLRQLAVLSLRGTDLFVRRNGYREETHLGSASIVWMPELARVLRASVAARIADAEAKAKKQPAEMVALSD